MNTDEITMVCAALTVLCGVIVFLIAVGPK